MGGAFNVLRLQMRAYSIMRLTATHIDRRPPRQIVGKDEVYVPTRVDVAVFRSARY